MAYPLIRKLVALTASNAAWWALYEKLDRLHSVAKSARVHRDRERLMADYRATLQDPTPEQPTRSSRKSMIAYDVGMNNGDDTEYYLAKGFSVVGIEANPELCQACTSKFSSYIATERLKIINCAVGAVEGSAQFYVNRDNHVLSSLQQPSEGLSQGSWTSVPVQMRRLSSLIKEFGEPYFLKIDVEHADAIVLRDLLENGIMPPLISAESHAIDVFCLLVTMGYRKFKLVDGASVQAVYADHPIRTVDSGIRNFRFQRHSSGPFGEDIPGPWLDSNELLDQLLAGGLGWVDIHARQ
jgi:FkbM family methyltransferase